MTLQFNMVALLLVFLIVLGLISQNSAITISAAVLLIMQQTLLSKYQAQVFKTPSRIFCLTYQF